MPSTAPPEVVVAAEASAGPASSGIPSGPGRCGTDAVVVAAVLVVPDLAVLLRLAVRDVAVLLRLTVRDVAVLLRVVPPHAATAQAATNDINVLTRLRAISRGER